MLCSLVAVLQKLRKNGRIKQDYAVQLIVIQFQYNKSEQGRECDYSSGLVYLHSDGNQQNLIQS